MVTDTRGVRGSRNASGDQTEGLSVWFPLASRCWSEVALAVQERHAHHGHAQIGGGTQGIPGQHAQATAVGGHGRVKANLHGEIGDRRRLNSCLRLGRDHVYSLSISLLPSRFVLQYRAPNRTAEATKARAGLDDHSLWGSLAVQRMSSCGRKEVLPRTGRGRRATSASTWAQVQRLTKSMPADGQGAALIRRSPERRSDPCRC